MQCCNAGDSRLSSRTKRLRYPSDAGKESLTEPWCISAEPGSCCSQRDLTPLWHRRAQGKFFLNARGSSGKLTFMSLRRQHQKMVSAALKGGLGDKEGWRWEREPWEAECANETWCICNLFELIWMLASISGFKSTFILYSFWTLLLFQNSLFTITVWHCSALYRKIVRASLSHLQNGGNISFLPAFIQLTRLLGPEFFYCVFLYCLVQQDPDLSWSL